MSVKTKNIGVREEDYTRLTRIRGKRIIEENHDVSMPDIITFLLDYYEKKGKK